MRDGLGMNGINTPETSGESFLETKDEYKFIRYCGGSMIAAVLVKGSDWKQYYCKFCGNKVPKDNGRRYYCNQACSDEMNIRGGFFKYQVWKRDNSRCQECGEKGDLDIDHIIPVIEGGGSCGLDNLRLLCKICHKKETKALAKRRKEKRDLIKNENSSPNN